MIYKKSVLFWCIDVISFYLFAKILKRKKTSPLPPPLALTINHFKAIHQGRPQDFSQRGRRGLKKKKQNSRKKGPNSRKKVTKLKIKGTKLTQLRTQRVGAVQSPCGRPWSPFAFSKLIFSQFSIRETDCPDRFPCHKL
mgnify:CR=1 FL=1